MMHPAWTLEYINSIPDKDLQRIVYHAEKRKGGNPLRLRNSRGQLVGTKITPARIAKLKLAIEKVRPHLRVGRHGLSSDTAGRT